MVTPRAAPLHFLRQQFAEIAHAAESLDENRVLRLLNGIVPEFVPSAALAAPRIQLPVVPRRVVRTRTPSLPLAAMPVEAAPAIPLDAP